MLTKDELLELAKKQYPGRPEIVRMLVLAEPRQMTGISPGRNGKMDEIIELSVTEEVKILLSVKDGRIGHWEGINVSGI